MEEETQNMFLLTFGQRVMRALRRAGRWIFTPVFMMNNCMAYRINYSTILWEMQETQSMITEIHAVTVACRTNVEALERKLAEQHSDRERYMARVQKHFMELVKNRFDGYHRQLKSLDDRVANLKVEYANKLMVVALAMAKVKNFGPGKPDEDSSEAWALMMRVEELFSALMDEVTLGMREIQAEIKMAYHIYDDKPHQFCYDTDSSPIL